MSATPHRNAQQILELASKFEQSLKSLMEGRRLALLSDFPNHSNVGDSAIYLGELCALRRLGAFNLNVDVADFLDIDIGAYSLLEAGSVILIHGGGNFGDLYPVHQRARCQLLARHPQHRIIQLPQSIHFTSEDAIQETAQVIRAHPDFHLMVRDEASFRLARQHFSCSLYLVPDAAFSLGPLRRTREAELDTYGLIRTDCESSPQHRPDLISADSEQDWLEESDTAIKKLLKRLQYLMICYPSLKLHRTSVVRLVRRALYERVAVQRLNRGMRQLSLGRQVVTDRLHAWILCFLLDIPCISGDNSYKKIASLRDTWGLVDEV